MTGDVTDVGLVIRIASRRMGVDINRGQFPCFLVQFPPRDLTVKLELLLKIIGGKRIERLIDPGLERKPES